MKIQVLQPNIEWESPTSNLLHFEKMLCEGTGGDSVGVGCHPEAPAGRHEDISPATGVDLIVLPEMFATGFGADLGSMNSDSEQIVAWMRHMASRMDAAIVGSVAVNTPATEGDTSETSNNRPPRGAAACDAARSTLAATHSNKLYNRLFFVRPSGEVTTYDKRHLFTYSGENRAYSAGNERVVVEWRGVRLLLQICYDLRFPVFSRNRGGGNGTREPWDGDYDVAIYVASWPDARVNVWDLLLRARAIENVCYVVGCNRVGTDPTAHYNGHSAILNYLGQRIDDGGSVEKRGANAIQTTIGAETVPTETRHADSRLVETETILTADISISNLTRFRRKFPVLGDADDFTLQL